MNQDVSKQLHQQSQKLWAGCVDSFLAPAEYYERVGSELRSMLSVWGPFDDALDIGCGNGRFTMTLAQYCPRVIGYDLSPALITQARRASAGVAPGHVDFAIADVGELVAHRRFHLVSCMGVTSTLIAHHAFERALRLLVDSVQIGGFLLVRDTLVSNPTDEIVREGDYVALYRSEADYESQLERRNFRLLEKRPLSESGHRINNLYLFRGAGA